jgi:DNA mismatch repair protein MutS
MLVQYLEMKRQHPDSILFYRMGDFYEMFFEDALKAAPILEVQLTSRDKNAAEPIPMCGVPHHSAITYIQKLLSHGLKVALCEQVEDPAKSQGIVKREVVRVLTPSLVGDPDLVRDDQKYLLLSVEPLASGETELCLLDLFASELRLGVAPTLAALEEITREFQPKEILASETTASQEWFKQAFPHQLISVRPYFGSAEEALIRYVQETQKTQSIPVLRRGLALFGSDRLMLDSVTLASLEITRPASEGGHSLCETIDLTVTSMGRRLLKDWLTRPSRQNATIEARLDCVQAFMNERDSAENTRALLSQMRDLERLATKTALGLAMPRDIVAIREVLLKIPQLKSILSASLCHPMQALGNGLEALESLANYLQAALEDSPPAVYREGGIFRAEFHPEVAEYRTLSFDAKSTLALMEDRERNRTGIPSLKIKFSKVFGYTIEITNSHLAKVPSDYIRKQTISTGERFITPELKEFEEKVISAEQRLKNLEEALFLETRQKVAAHSPTLLGNARLLAEIDVLQSFARFGQTHGYQRPVFNSAGILEIEEGRHPVVESLLPAGTFVPNSISFKPDGTRTWIITGPNMGGKSTIMRQIALTCVLAQCGSFVPAQKALLPLLDSVFTRIGSSDDLARGRSTFMVEMTEVARILRSATPDSLILIDEIGRGTSTYDGLALAWSLLEYLHTEVRAKTLFATHFHEISSLENVLPGLNNANVLVEKWKEEVVFLYKLAQGACNRSYGIEVAKLAGVPKEVLGRAKEIQGLLETQSQRGGKARQSSLTPHAYQLGFFDDLSHPQMPSPLES